MRVERAVEHYLRHLTVERGLSRNTLLAYRRDLERYGAFLCQRGRVDIAEVTESDVEDFLSFLRTPSPEAAALAVTSVARVLSAVRSLHRFLCDDDLVDEDVARAVRPPKLPARLPKALSIDQMTALLEAAAGDDVLALRDRALLETLYATGARVSEVVSLDVDDIDSESDMVRVMGKGSKQRLVPLGGYARDAIAAYLVRARPVLSARGKATPALFLGARGGRLSRQGAWLIIQGTAERAGLAASVSPHTFRHSFATHLISGGADVRVVQDLLGHASVTTTQVYTQVSADSLIEMYQHAHPRAR